MAAISITDLSPLTDQDKLQQEFATLAQQWREETIFLSSMTAKLAHPAYQRIIGLGGAAVPLLLRELELRSGYWFRALTTLTGQNPTQPHDDFEQAREAWLDWGRRQGLIK